VRNMAPWRVFLWVKLIEVIVQLRPKALGRWLFQRDPRLRHATRWYYRMGRRVWFHEIRNFLFRETRTRVGCTLRQFWGEPQDHEEESMRVSNGKRERGAAMPMVGLGTL
jgi:anaerobic magnesium-protoporphyrin IX monomethyl ester cyclase